MWYQMTQRYLPGPSSAPLPRAPRIEAIAPSDGALITASIAIALRWLPDRWKRQHEADPRDAMQMTLPNASAVVTPGDAVLLRMGLTAPAAQRFC